MFNRFIYVTAGGCCRDFRRAAPAAGDELEAGVLAKLLKVLSAGAPVSEVEGSHVFLFVLNLTCSDNVELHASGLSHLVVFA